MTKQYTAPLQPSALIRGLTWLGRPDLAVLLAVFGLAGGTLAFIQVANATLAGAIAPWDEMLLLALRNPADLSDPIGPLWLQEIARDFSGLGGIGTLFLLSASVLAYLLLSGRFGAAIFTIMALNGGFLVRTVLKHGFDRPRPDLVPHGTEVFSSSFPSGHTIMATVVYLTLAAMLARVLPSYRLKALVLLVALTVTILTGASRVYLGVHWPSDVLAGWTAGAAWVSLCWLTAHWLQRRGSREAAPSKLHQ